MRIEGQQTAAHANEVDAVVVGAGLAGACTAHAPAESRAPSSSPCESIFAAATASAALSTTW
jgi:succinate dehydrogenase/fumarate reductase flavoprotein subunit